MAKYKEGDRVRLLPWEDQPEEVGTVCGDPVNEMYIVALDEEYIKEKGDDGLRELSEDQMEPL